MNAQKIHLKHSILFLIILAAALSRLLPHPHNFTPIGAIGLFGAAYFSRRYLAFLAPFAAMWISDLLLNNLVYAHFYPEGGFRWWGNAWVYLSFALIVCLGFALLRQVKLSHLLAASLGASTLFFMVTNFGVWLGSPMFPRNWAGLSMTYALGLPFFLNTLLGDLFFTALLFGSFEWAQRRFPALLAAEKA
jgi:hypothetical protein